MKSFMAQRFTYRLVTNIVTREASTNEVHQIIGTTKNPKFPHEYAISGWFKWTQP